MKSCDNADLFRNQFGGLLRGRALPDAEGAWSASGEGGGERNGGVDENAAGGDRRLELFEQRGLTFEGNGQHKNVGGGSGGGIFHSRDTRRLPSFGFDLRRNLTRAFFVARSDDDRLSGARPAESESHPGRAGASNDGDRTSGAGIHANSGSSDCSAVKADSLNGSLILMREYVVLRSAGIRPISRISA